MTDIGKILIADDEDTFSQATADLLRQEGYHCDCAPDADTAERMLANNVYDLLIADIKMPGNPELEFIKKLPQIAQGIPVILVTGYPSLRTAIQSIQLPVAAYLTKPVEFDELRAHVRTSLESSRVFRTIQNTRQRLEDSCGRLNDIEQILKATPKQNNSTTINNFIELTFMNILGALSDLRYLTDTAVQGNDKQEACHLLNCPKLKVLTGALTSTIDVLEQTKNSFKSKELGELRKKLEMIIKGNSNDFK
jgi:DNA-binding response OmpR family regulator